MDHYMQELRNNYHILTGNFAPGDWTYADFEKEIEKAKLELLQEIQDEYDHEQEQEQINQRRS